MKFAKNDYIELDGRKIVIIDLLGEGGQGEVYLVDDNGNKKAFKIYKDNPSSDFRYNLRNNIKKGAPNESFLWPEEIVEFEDDSCGYLMNIRPKNFQPFSAYLNGKIKFASTHLMVNWCIDMVNAYKKLHELGFSYQDINEGSFFFDPTNGKLLICDNDNVTADKRNLGVLGMMRYMAPEIVRGDKNPLTGENQMPDVHSDRFSLAVILFMTLVLGRPFEGECLKKYTIIDEKAEYEMYGSNPVYIYNEKDTSNRPIRGYHTAVINRFPLIPSYIKAAFHKTFTEGLKDRENGRTTEIEWLRLLCQYRDELMTCSCGREFIYGFQEKKQNKRCPFCKRDTNRFCYLHIGKHKVILEPEKLIYKFHIDKYSSDYSTPVMKVVRNKNNPEIWGIKLNLDEEVFIKDKNGKEMTIPKDGVIPIISELKIKFNNNLIGQIIVEN